MRSSIVNFFSGLIVCVYVIVVGFLAFFIISNLNTGNEVAFNDFNKLVRVMQDNGKVHGNLSQAQLAILKSHVDANSRVKAVLVENSGLVCLAYPADSGCFDRDASFHPVLNGATPFTKVFSTRITSRIADDTRFSVAISLIDPTELLPKLKLALAVLVATTILALCIIMYCGYDDYKDVMPVFAWKRKQVRPHFDESHRNGGRNFGSKRFRRGFGGIKMEVHNNVNSPVPSGDGTGGGEKNSTTYSVYEDVVRKNGEPVVIKEESILHSSQDRCRPDGDKIHFENKKGSDPLPEYSEPAVVPPKVNPIRTETSYIESCLDAELRKATAADKNLVLLRISISGLNNSSIDGQNVAKLIAGRYSRDNYIFDYNVDGYAVVLQDTELEAAISGCEELYSYLDGELAGRGITGKLSMGLSCRALRTLTGGRLLREACAALDKAETSAENPIVAFRVDSAKFARYMDESYQTQETT